MWQKNWYDHQYRGEIIKQGGGDISSGLAVKNEQDKMFFVKFNFGDIISPAMFEGEKSGLESMKETNCGLVIPTPLKVHKNGILMEHVQFWLVFMVSRFCKNPKI